MENLNSGTQFPLSLLTDFQKHSVAHPLECARCEAFRANQSGLGLEFAKDVESLGKSNVLLDFPPNDSVQTKMLRPWPGPLIGFYLGIITPEAIRKSIEKIASQRRKWRG